MLTYAEAIDVGSDQYTQQGVKVRNAAHGARSGTHQTLQGQQVCVVLNSLLNLGLM